MNREIVLWIKKSWAARLAFFAALACVIKGVVDLAFGRSMSEEISLLFAVAIPGGALVGSVIDGIQKGHEKERFKSRERR